jgi:hypothetical protein
MVVLLRQGPLNLTMLFSFPCVVPDALTEGLGLIT